MRLALKRVTGAPLPSAMLRRDPPACEVSPGGAVVTNVNGHDELDALAQAKGLDLSLYAITIAYDESKRQIYAYPDEPEAVDSVNLNRLENHRYSFSVATIFGESKKLRIAASRVCSFRQGVDPDNVPCIVIALNSSGEKRAAARKESSAQPTNA